MAVKYEVLTQLPLLEVEHQRAEYRASTKKQQAGRPVVDLVGKRFDGLVVIAATDQHVARAAVWLCRCDCGNEVKKSGTSLRAIVTGSARGHCGCKGSGRTRSSTRRLGVGSLVTLPRKGNWEAAMHHLFGSYQRAAEKRGYGWKLTKQEFYDLTQKPCTYCGSSPQQEHNPGNSAPFVYNGIDRIDNTQGYVRENCCPCCGVCNQMKLDMELSAFREHLSRMTRHMQIREGGWRKRQIRFAKYCGCGCQKLLCL